MKFKEPNHDQGDDQQQHDLHDSNYHENLIHKVSQLANQILVNPQQASVPTEVDLTYITPKILVLSQPSDHQEESYDGSSLPNVDDGGDCSSSITSAGGVSIPSPMSQPISMPQDKLNEHEAIFQNFSYHSSACIGRYMNQRHNQKYIMLNLTDFPCSSSVCSGLSYQIIDLGWMNACSREYGMSSVAEVFMSSHKSHCSSNLSGESERNPKNHYCTNLPALPHILNACYIIKAFLELGSDRVIGLFCKNGKTRSGIVVACYLKYIGVIRNSIEAFRLFCSKRRSTFLLDGSSSDHGLPPSLEIFFSNFDVLVDVGTWPHSRLSIPPSVAQKPGIMFFKGIAMEGIPVAHLPHIRIFNCGSTIYDSHILGHDSDLESISESITSRILADEHGMSFYYPVSRQLQGEFIIVCTFGETNNQFGSQSVIWRYANSTGFLHRGFLEISVDVPVSLRDEYQNNFIVTLMLDKIVNDSSDHVNDESIPIDEQKHEDEKHGSYLEGKSAIIQGWKLMRSVMKASNGISSSSDTTTESSSPKSLSKSSKRHWRKSKRKQRQLADLVNNIQLEEYVNNLLKTSTNVPIIPTSPPSVHLSPPATPNTQANNLLHTLDNLQLPRLDYNKKANLNMNLSAHMSTLVPPANCVYQPQEGDVTRNIISDEYAEKFIVSFGIILDMHNVTQIIYLHFLLKENTSLENDMMPQNLKLSYIPKLPLIMRKNASHLEEGFLNVKDVEVLRRASKRWNNRYTKSTFSDDESIGSSLADLGNQQSSNDKDDVEESSNSNNDGTNPRQPPALPNLSQESNVKPHPIEYICKCCREKETDVDRKKMDIDEKTQIVKNKEDSFVEEKKEDPDNSSNKEDILRNDPEYAKYWKMLKM